MIEILEAVNEHPWTVCWLMLFIIICLSLIFNRD